MVVDNLFSVIHATVADLNGIAVEDFSKCFLKVFVFVCLYIYIYIYMAYPHYKNLLNHN